PQYVAKFYMPQLCCNMPQLSEAPSFNVKVKDGAAIGSFEFPSLAKHSHICIV
ncbi:11341_t:CDS:1, partial [Ambispora gerdemannii]